MRMGRRGKPGMPPHMARKGNAFYYVPGSGDRGWIALGSDKARALVLWAEYEGRGDNGTYDDLFRWFMASAKLSANTRKNYNIQGAAFCRVFGHMTPDSITTHMLADYRDKCPPGTANVRIGLAKTVYAAAKEKGKCTTNPARDVKRLPRVSRDRLIDDSEFTNVYAVAEDFSQIAMDLLYQLSWRPGDVCKLKLADVSEAGVFLTAQKTGKKTLYSMTPDLAAIFARARALPRGVKSLYVLCDYRGQPYTVARLRKAWIAACKLAGVTGAQQRDIRAKSASDDPDGAQKRLQHSDPRQTQTYIRSTPVVTPLPRRIVEGSTKVAEKSKQIKG